MNAEFNWWLLIVGLVVGAGLVWVVIGDWSRREEDLSEDERAAEAAWIADTLRERGDAVDAGAADEILAMHRAYLRATGTVDLPPEAPDEPDIFEADHGRLGWTAREATEAGWVAADHERLGRPAAAATDSNAEWVPADHERVGRPTASAIESEADIETPGGALPPTGGRPSVRSTPLSPRGGRPRELESEPPA